MPKTSASDVAPLPLGRELPGVLSGPAPIRVSTLPRRRVDAGGVASLGGDDSHESGLGRRRQERVSLDGTRSSATGPGR